MHLQPKRKKIKASSKERKERIFKIDHEEQGRLNYF